MNNDDQITPERHPAPGASAPDASPQPSRPQPPIGDPDAEEGTADPATPAQPVDPLTAARAHKQRVRQAATRRVASLALLFLTLDRAPVDADTETHLVHAAWAAAAAALGHQTFVRTLPATFADLDALAR